jgi:hypothetical protein
MRSTKNGEDGAAPCSGLFPSSRCAWLARALFVAGACNPRNGRNVPRLAERRRASVLLLMHTYALPVKTK